ncbi:MAG: hypothetical protein HZA30_04500 [Candidatus Omnitrophica bacterium]|nr:hypothetical protein [Candidatus Omnitrophota bacterium]
MEIQATKQLKPVDYLKIFFRRKWYFIIPTVMGLIFGILAGNFLPKVYEASTLILVEEGRVINPLIQGLAVSSSTAQRLAVLREQILGWDRLIQLIKGLNLARDVRTQQQFEDLIKRLRKNIDVNLKAPNIISISYEGKDPVEAQNIVKTITDIFIAENLRQQNKETEDAIAFINDQVELYQKKLKQSEIASLEDQLNKLLVDSTGKHPLVVELKKTIEAHKTEMNQGNYEITPSAVAGSDTELKVLKDELKQIKEELTTSSFGVTDGGVNRTKLATATNEKLYKLLLLERIGQVEARDATVTQKLYNTLLERLETAKITQRLESSKEGTRYTILDPTRLPLKPRKPNKILTLLMGIFLGAGAGVGLIFAMELFDHSVLGIDEAKEFLELPIFAAISKIVTENDLKRQKIRNLRIVGVSTVTGVVLLVVIIFTVFM